MPSTPFSKHIFFILVAVSFSLVPSGCGSDTDDKNTSPADTYSADVAGDGEGDEDATVADGGAADADAQLEEPLPPRPWSVSEPGPYQVGYTQREVIYDARGTDEPRELRLAVWYPTTDVEGQESRYWERIKRKEAFRDASIAIDPAEPAPLLVFSHGNAAMAEQSYFMAEFFASHGWVIVAPDHQGNTLLDTVGAIDLTSAVFRSQDITAVLDYVLGFDAEEPLYGAIDAEKIVLSGHSFGGFTSLASSGATFAVDELIAFCEVDDDNFCEILEGREDWSDILRDGFYDARIKVSIPQAPGGYQAFRGGLANIQMPTLLMTGRMDNTLKPDEEGNPIWANMSGSQHLRVDILKAGHFTFSNMCALVGGTIDELKNDGCSPDFIDVELGYEIINAYSLAFARAHLFGDTSADALLSGEDTRYADSVELMRLEDTP